MEAQKGKTTDPKSGHKHSPCLAFTFNISIKWHFVVIFV